MIFFRASILSFNFSTANTSWAAQKLSYYYFNINIYNDIQKLYKYYNNKYCNNKNTILNIIIFIIFIKEEHTILNLDIKKFKNGESSLSLFCHI